MTTQRPSDSDLNHNLNNVHARKATADEVSYRDGYVQGQASEQRYQYSRERISESNGVANGLLIGLAFAALIGIGVGGFLYATRSSEPNPVTPAPAATQQPKQPQQRTTIIERTVDRTKEVTPSVPDVQINVPTPPVEPDAAPQAADEAPTVPNPTENSTQGNQSQPQDNTTAPSETAQ